MPYRKELLDKSYKKAYERAKLKKQQTQLEKPSDSKDNKYPNKRRKIIPGTFKTKNINLFRTIENGSYKRTKYSFLFKFRKQKAKDNKEYAIQKQKENLEIFKEKGWDGIQLIPEKDRDNFHYETFKEVVDRAKAKKIITKNTVYDFERFTIIEQMLAENETYRQYFDYVNNLQEQLISTFEDLHEMYQEYINTLDKTLEKIDSENDDYLLQKKNYSLEAKEEIKERKNWHEKRMARYRADTERIFESLKKDLDSMCDKIEDEIEPIPPIFKEAHFATENGILSNKLFRKRAIGFYAEEFYTELKKWISSGGLNKYDVSSSQSTFECIGYFHYRLSEIFYKNKYQLANGFRSDKEAYDALREIADHYKIVNDESWKEEQKIIDEAKEKYAKNINSEDYKIPEIRKMQYFWHKEDSINPFNITKHIIRFDTNSIIPHPMFWYRHTISGENRSIASYVHDKESDTGSKDAHFQKSKDADKWRLLLFNRNNFPLTYSNTFKGYKNYSQIYWDVIPNLYRKSYVYEIDRKGNKLWDVNVKLGDYFNPMTYKVKGRVIWGTANYGFGTLCVFLQIGIKRPSPVRPHITVPCVTPYIGWVDDKNHYDFKEQQSDVVNRINDIIHWFFNGKEDYIVKNNTDIGFQYKNVRFVQSDNKFFHTQTMKDIIFSLDVEPTFILDFDRNIVLRFDKGYEKGKTFERNYITDPKMRDTKYEVDEILRITLEDTGRINFLIDFNNPIMVSDAYGRNMIMDNIEWLVNNIDEINFGKWMEYFRKRYFKVVDGFEYDNEVYKNNLMDFVKAILDTKESVNQDKEKEKIKANYLDYLKRNNDGKILKFSDADNAKLEIALNSPSFRNDITELDREREYYVLDDEYIEDMESLQEAIKEKEQAEEEYQKAMSGFKNREWRKKNPDFLTVEKTLDFNEDRFVSMLKEHNRKENYFLTRDSEEFHADDWQDIFNEENPEEEYTPEKSDLPEGDINKKTIWTKLDESTNDKMADRIRKYLALHEDDIIKPGEEIDLDELDKLGDDEE